MGARESIVRALLAGKPGGPHPGGIHVYHSSPHDFDKFDWSKLRTGEGANVYGSGFYFAENPAVSGQGGEYWKAFANRFGKSSGENTATEYLARAGFDREKAKQALQHALDNPPEYTSGYNKMTQERMRQDALKILESGQHVGPRTYEVNINARPELMLDWDKGLQGQSPQVRSALQNVDSNLVRRWMMDPEPYKDVRGENIYEQLAGRHDPVGASEQLRDAGIPGIRYLDEGSRNIPARKQQMENTLAIARAEAAKGSEMMANQIPGYEAAIRNLQPTYNYVVTDPGKLDILAKYGVVGTAGGGLSALAAQDQYGASP